MNYESFLELTKNRRSIRAFKKDPVPDCMKLFGMIALGYPDMEPMPKKMRGLDKMIHYDECAEGDFRTLDEVKAFCTP